MKLEEIPDWYQAKYELTCNCGKSHELRTEPDMNPNFYASVYVKCVCGEYILFDLPVG